MSSDKLLAYDFTSVADAIIERIKKVRSDMKYRIARVEAKANTTKRKRNNI